MYTLWMDPLLDTLRVDLHTVAAGRLSTLWRASDSRQPYARLYLIHGGTGHVYFRGTRYELRGEHLYIIPPLTPMTYACDTHLDIQWVHFNARLLNGLDLFHYLACSYQVENPDSAYLSEQFERLAERFREPGPASHLEQTGIMLQLLAPFVASVDPEHQSRRYQQVKRFAAVLEYIDEHLAEGIRLDDLATLVHLEKTYFSSLFTEHFGVAPIRYIHQRRTERAFMLLWTTDQTVAQIADSLGYTDAGHFSRTFKAITHISPSDFRAQRHAPQP